MNTYAHESPKRRNFGSFWRIVMMTVRAKTSVDGDYVRCPMQRMRRNNMISFKRTKKRNYRNPREAYLISAVAAAFAVCIILMLVGFLGRNTLRAQLSETQDMLASSIQSDISKALNSYEGIGRKSANLSGDILPTMRRHMYAAYEMNRILVETCGEEYSMIDEAQYDSFESVMDQFDRLIAAGQSTDPAKESLTVCMDTLKASIANRFTAEGSLLPKTASATTSKQP